MEAGSKAASVGNKKLVNNTSGYTIQKGLSEVSVSLSFLMSRMC